MVMGRPREFDTAKALDEAMVSGATGGFNEMFTQLDALLLTFA